MKQTLILIVALVAGIGLMIGASKLSTKYLVPLMRENPETVAAVPAVITKPVEAAAAGAMQDHLEAVNAKQEEIRERQRLEREAKQPKAYRWRNEKGMLTISDKPPPPGIEAEVIPLQSLR